MPQKALLRLADSNIRPIAFRPDLKAFVLSGAEVAVIGETERTALRGRSYAEVVPLIDGTQTADEIVEALASRLAPELAYWAIGRLEAGGFITHLPAPIDSAPDTDPCGHLTAPRTIALSSNDICLTAIGLPHSAVDMLASRLSAAMAHSSFGSAVPCDVLLTDDYLRPELGQGALRASRSGRAFFPARPVGRLIWIGPYLAPHSETDWAAIDKRLRDNRAADAAAIELGYRFPIVRVALAPTDLETGLGLTADVVEACLSGDVPPQVHRAIWTIDTQTSERTTHALYLGDRTAEDASGTGGHKNGRIELPPTPKHFTTDGGHRSCTPEETLARLKPLVSPITGIIHGIQAMPAPRGIHIYKAAQSRPVRPATAHANRLLGQPAGAGGKGKTAVQAQVSCMAEAIERYSCSCFGDEIEVRRPFYEVAADAVHPNTIMLFSADQYRNRDRLNAGREDRYSYNWVPEPTDPDLPIGWVSAWSLTHDRPRLVPGALCYFGYGQAQGRDEHRFGRTNSNGCAAGNTLPEAILQGLLELIERDACALWWYNRARRPGLALETLGDPFVDQMIARYGAMDRALHVLDLTSDLGIPVALAVSWRSADGGEIHIGIGCHLEARLAVSRALTELNQVAFSDLTNMSANDENRYVDVDHLAWLRTETVQTQPYVRPLVGQTIDAASLADLSSDDISEDVRFCVDRLAEKGLETLVLDQTRPEIGFPTARVIVPGLRHFWSRLAPGRLYDVPLSLGWITQARAERDLNPIPFFL